MNQTKKESTKHNLVSYMECTAHHFSNRDLDVTVSWKKASAHTVEIRFGSSTLPLPHLAKLGKFFNEVKKQIDGMNL